jgi:uncharacterized membrane protein YeiH
MQDIFVWFAFAGTAVFAISGAMVGLRKSMDVVGVSFVATLTGVGGGTVRDLLLGAGPVGWVLQPTDIAICLTCAVLACCFNKLLIGRRAQWLLYADAAGIALFAVLGAAKAEAAGAHPLVAILFGAMSACFGGILRDVVCGEPPVLFRREIYVSAALLGGAVFILLPAETGFDMRAVAGLVAGLILRLCAIRWGWSFPFPHYGKTAD